MDREAVIRMVREVADKDKVDPYLNEFVVLTPEELERFAALVAAHERKAFMEIIEPYLIPVGNSRSGELACEWNVRTAKEKNT